MDQLDMVLNLAAQNNAWSAEQAQKQMDFQERMSNTAHQREIADLKASGLNPVLSSKLAGASTPSGSSATADSSVIGAVVEVLKEFGEGMMSSAASGFARGASSTAGFSALDAFANREPFLTEKQEKDLLLSLVPYKYRTAAKAVIDPVYDVAKGFYQKFDSARNSFHEKHPVIGAIVDTSHTIANAVKSVFSKSSHKSGKF